MTDSSRNIPPRGEGARHARQAAQLRENLRRRKEQARARGQAATPADGGPENAEETEKES